MVIFHIVHHCIKTFQDFPFGKPYKIHALGRCSKQTKKHLYIIPAIRSQHRRIRQIPQNGIKIPPTNHREYLIVNKISFDERKEKQPVQRQDITTINPGHHRHPKQRPRHAQQVRSHEHRNGRHGRRAAEVEHAGDVDAAGEMLGEADHPGGAGGEVESVAVGLAHGFYTFEFGGIVVTDIVGCDLGLFDVFVLRL